MKRFLNCFLISMVTIPLLLSGCSQTKVEKQTQKTESNLEASLAVDVSTLKASDNQPLLVKNATIKKIPARPTDPKAFPEDISEHWYDYEYAGWNVVKDKLPKSPADGAKGKKITFIQWGDHPYFTAVVKGAQKISDAYSMQLTVLKGDWTIETQEKQVEETIKTKPDLIIIQPADEKKCVNEIKKIYDAGIPVIATNILPTDEAQKYIVSYTGPDDWSNTRNLAKKFTELLNNEGGYAVIQHKEGSSPYYARTYAFSTEIKKLAPNMKFLDGQSGKLDKEASKKIVQGWLAKYGNTLKGITTADDGTSLEGIIAALKEAGRSDVVVVGNGNCKVGMDFVKSGDTKAITYQSPETDGATAVKVAVDWFNGEEVRPIVYMPVVDLITQTTVDKYLPAQW